MINLPEKPSRQNNIAVNVLSSILNGMDSLIYVTDPYTDELLFVNQIMRKSYNLPENIGGQTCWKALYPKQNSRCPLCPVKQLSQFPDANITGEENNYVNGRIYKNTDCMIKWADGQLAHLRHSVDITKQTNAEKAIANRLARQELMSGLAQRLLSGDDIDATIMESLSIAGSSLNVRRVMLAHCNKNKQIWEFPYIWPSDARAGFQTPRYVFTQDSLLAAALTEQKKAFISNDIFPAKEVLPWADKDKEGQPFMLAPIVISGKLWGILSADQAEPMRQWSDDDIQFIRLFGTGLAGSISRAAIRADLMRMSSISSNSPQFICYINKDGGLEYINRSALLISGYSLEEFDAYGIGLILSKRDYERIIKTGIPLVLQKGKSNTEVTVTIKDGSRRLFQLSAFPAPLRNKTIGIGVIANDITQERQMKKDLLAAKQQAEKSNRAKSDFLSRMSHEMRTPLNAIIGMSNIGMAAEKPERKEYCLTRIDEASQHLLGVINDVLDMSKIEANKFDLYFHEFSFENMLHRTCNVVMFRANEKRQHFFVDLDETIPLHIISDEQRLSQVIVNLLTNAIKFTPEGGRVTMSAQKFAETGSACSLRVTVKDSGIGISEEQQTQIFKAFEQAEGGISRNFGGTGLGLAISKRIVEMMQGRIWVESKLGEGATFIFEVIVEKGAIPSVQLAHANWNKLRVLVADNVSEVRNKLRSMLISHGLNCVTAENGEEACRIMAKERAPFDMAFIARQMSNMDGIELARIINQKSNGHTKIILISSSHWNDVEEKAKEAGVAYFLQKPIFQSMLIDCINNLTGLSQQPSVGELSDNKQALTGRQLLLVEDMEINREIACALLEPTGIAIDYAADGQEAVDAFTAHPEKYDIILMDIHMPKMDGYEATRHIRASGLPQAGTVPIIAMTANVFKEDIEKCLAVGMNEHISKPVNVKDMMNKLKKILL